ncbi:ABC transporter permease [Actinokineospora guangxiensis]|uniref:ABC transporter permease n=1 Tax=Actinokineospora guangxiensis TaxID=1490288 RepID=A0ABW0EW21_9PSEU
MTRTAERNASPGEPGGPSTDEPTVAKAPRSWPWQLVVFAAFLAVWHVGVQAGWLSRRSFAEPGQVLAWMWEWHSTGESLPHLGFTLSAAAMGYLVGIALGSTIAVLFFFVPFLGRVFNPFMALVNGIPKIVLAPLLVLVFGLGLESKIATAGLLVFFASYFNFSGGLRSVNQVLIDNTRAMGASTPQMATSLYVPALVAWTISTLRVGIAFALLGVVVGEFVGSNQGVGWNIRLAGELAEPERLLGALITLGLIAALVDRLLVGVERRYSQWKLA